MHTFAEGACYGSEYHFILTFPAALQQQQTACSSRLSRGGTIMRSIASHAPVAHSWSPVSLQHSRCFTKQRPARLPVHRQAVVLTRHRQQFEDCTVEEQLLQRRAVLQTLAAVICAVILPAVAPPVASAGAVAMFSNVDVLLMCFCGQVHVATHWTLTTFVSCTADLEQFSNPKEGYRIDRPTSWEQTSEGIAITDRVACAAARDSVSAFHEAC